MGLLLIVLFVVSLASAITYNVRRTDDAALGTVRGICIGAAVWLGLAIVAMAGRLLFLAGA